MKSFELPKVDWSDAPATLAALRQMTSGVAFMGLHDIDVDEESLDCPTSDGRTLELRVHRLSPFSPPNAQPDSPLIVLFHGGHHVLGFPGILSPLAGSLAKKFNAVVVSASYALAPEHPFPAGVNDAWDVLQWCAKHANDTIYADPSKGFIVGGVSSGGSLSVILAHKACDEGLQPPLTGLYLACASIRAPGNDASRLPKEYQERFLSRTQDECVKSPVLPAPMVDFMDKLYKADRTSELYAPLLWSTGHANLPRTYTQVCGIDTSRDESLIFEDMIKKEGVPTKVDMYAGLPHAFWLTVLGVLPSMTQVENWKKDTLSGFEWLLQKP